MDKKQIFVNGLHSDNEPALQPENTYRDAKNGTLTAYGENRYSFESIRGTVVSFTIPTHYNSKLFQPIGWSSHIDFLIIHSANDNGVDDLPGEIGKVTFDNSGNGTYIPLYYHQGLRYTKEHPIPNDDGIVMKPETQGIVRNVWTDDFNSMRSVNVVDPVFTDYIASGDLVVGEKYMVLVTDASSYITHNAFDWAPGRAGDGVSQNVFTATSNAYTTTGTTAKVIKYVAIDALAVTVDFAPGSVLYKGWTAGNLPTASYQYFYQLETDNSSRTNYSYVSLPIAIVTDELPTNQSISYALQVNKAIGIDSKKAIKLTIDNIDSYTYTRIRVGFIKSTAEGVYDLPKIFLEQDITLGDTSIDVVHYGNEVILESLTLDDIEIAGVPLDLVKTITSTKNYLFAGNVGLGEDPLFDLKTDATVKCIEYLMPSDLLGDTPGVVNNIASGYAVFGHAQVQSATVGNADAYPNQWYEVVGTTGGSTYNAILYTPGQFFQGIAGTTTITPSGDSTAVAVIRIQKYTGEYQNIRIENDFCDYKGIMASHYLKGYWRRERYRPGLFVYGKKGQQNFVIPLPDKNIPEQFRDAAYVDPDTGAALGFDARLAESEAGDTTLSLRSIGLSFSNLDFQLIADAYGVDLDKLDTVVKGFSIVRLERDAQIVTQGVLWANVLNTGNNHIQTMSANDIGDDLYGAAPGLDRQPNSYMYYSPDNKSHYGGNPNVASGDELEVTDQYENVIGAPYLNAGQELNAANRGYYSKFYSQVTKAGGPAPYDKGHSTPVNTIRTTNIGNASEGITISGLGLFDNLADTAAVLPYGVSRRMRGCEGLYVTTTDDETANTGLGRFTIGDIHRTVINHIRPKENLYGDDLGDNEAVRSTYKYIFCGHYQALDSTFMAYMVGNSGIVDDVEVFGGDAYVSLFGFGRGFVKAADVDFFATGCVIPCESVINENWRGLTIRTFNDARFNAGGAPNGIQYEEYEEHTFHDAFVGSEKEIYFPARPQDFKAEVRDEHIVYRSLLKIDGEVSDNWKRWLLNNYQRVDGQHGAITNIRAKSERLFIWQQKGITYMPVLERQQTSTVLGNPVSMGVGGVIDRADELDFWIGNQHQMGLMEGERHFAWFDFRRKLMVRMSFGGQIQQGSLVKGLDAFFQTVFDDVESETGDTIFNSENPLTGKGIISAYDPRFKMGLMVFKYNDTVAGRTIEKDFAIGFSETLDKYVAFFDLHCNHAIAHNGFFLMSRNVRPGIANSTAYSKGDELTESGVNYVCILAYTSGSPATAISSDSTHWTSVSNMAQIFVNWRGDICKTFGIVRPWYVTPILKSDGETAIVCDSLEVGGNETAFSDIETQNGAGSASDLNIKSYHKDYSYFDGKWNFSLPLKNKVSRLVDNYLQVKMTVKNYSDDITTSLNKVKRVFYIKNSFRNKR